ncbi:MAG TPA: orotate phosphoribosyltransferase [Kofleriaceae bacterium]|nr:orotate phosphoribosyltransferase [Kofleriaceae bacterium]
MTDPDAPPFPMPPVLRDQWRRLREVLRARSFAEREVTLSSGRRSNFYIDCKQTSLCPEGQFLIGQLVRAAIDHVAPSAIAAGGLTLGADPIATATALMSFVAGKPLSAFVVRKEPKGHGTGAWLEGADGFSPGAPVVVVEDVITTGASTVRAIERVRDAGLEVVHVVALVDRQEGGREVVCALAPVLALYQRGDFLP